MAPIGLFNRKVVFVPNQPRKHVDAPFALLAARGAELTPTA